MLIPEKHILLSETILGLSYFVIQALVSPKTIDDLWDDYKIEVTQNRFPASHTFDNMILTVDYLFAIGIITIDNKGMLSL